MPINLSKSSLVVSLGILFATVILSGCAPTLPTIVPGEIYEGYPCQSQCEAFQAGFDAARNNQYGENSRCDKLRDKQRVGCLSYVHEYQLEHNQPAGYNFPVNQ